MRPERPAVRFPAFALALAVGLLLAGLGVSALAPWAHAASPAVTGSISGPSDVGESLTANYTVHASGGPAEAPNGTTVGSLVYNATLTGANTTGGSITPASGVLSNGSAKLTLIAPKAAGSLTISVVVTSSYQKVNRSNNLSYSVHIVQPFRLNATLIPATGVTIGPLSLTVTLDGTPVGRIHVPVVTSGSTYPIAFAFIDLTISPGWHTFAISLAAEHGLLTFPGGAQQYTQSFYVIGPAPDYTIWYVAGTVAFVGALFIWSTRVAARRRGRAKK
ncbi:MAG: hypothetical protein L3J95_01160 [Thermoplasmata archaeon]|nr:hypothetical protein [Thermoplasmata archaeon]MCI4359025.1 hypothetical protein [Thermoplasmata archaeon]